MAGITKVVISYNRIPKIRVALGPATDEIAAMTGEDLLTKILDDLTASKSGRIYGSHQASAPGEPPAYWSGELYESMSVKKTKKQVRLVITAPHAAYLEFGTVKMAPRPFIAPNMDWAQKRFIEMMRYLEGKL